MRPARTVFSNAEIPGRIHAMQSFLSEGRLPDGTRRWSAFSRPVLGYGHLPVRYRDQVAEAVYVVYSYDTPIAWVLEPTVGKDFQLYVIPDISYSPTTGQHQMACMDAWAEHMRRQGHYRRWPGRNREVVQVPSNAEAYGRTIRARAGGMDGVRPGETVGSDTGHVPRRSSYEGVTGDAMHYTPSAVHPTLRAHP